MNISVKEKKYVLASCNVCGVHNFKSALFSDTETTDKLYDVKIGTFQPVLCKDCMACLVGAIALEIDLRGDN